METEINRAAQIILKSKYVIALTGAGISVESGIRPFRGPGGLWTEHGEPPMDGYQRFMKNPKAHWENIMKRDSYLSELDRAISKAVPHAGHFALAEMEELGILKYLITQNIDNLHLMAGSKKVAEIHGNATKLRCVKCNTRYARDDISFDEIPPRCPRCHGIIKTDTVMFGEPIPLDVLEVCQREANRADCMLTVGTSAFVYPAAGIPLEIRRNGGMLVEVNLYESELTQLCEVSLRGKAGEILPELLSCVKKLKST
jgi:NAD-dependent deacetylase